MNFNEHCWMWSLSTFVYGFQRGSSKANDCPISTDTPQTKNWVLNGCPCLQKQFFNETGYEKCYLQYGCMIQPPKSTKKSRDTLRSAHNMTRHNVMSAMHKNLGPVQTPGAMSAQRPIYVFQTIQCYQYPTRNFTNATVKYGLMHQVHFVRWPSAIWCHAVWQMCTDVLWDDPVLCDVMQYGRCIKMFCEKMLQGGSCSLFKIQVFWTVHITSSATLLWEPHSYQALSHPLRLRN
jgi:hypothetical protein